MTIIRTWWSLLALAALLVPTAAVGQVYPKGGVLPLSLATEAAQAALNSCARRGYPVSIAVVDASGELRVFLKSDHATIHTKDSAFRKAYTAMTLGPIFRLDRTSALAEKLRANPNGTAFSNIPNILLLPGGVLVQSRDGPIASVGVSGSPDGMVDEACGADGLTAIASRLGSH